MTKKTNPATIHEETLDLRLYVIVRTELGSMTPGRIAAQVNHAGTQAVHHIQTSKSNANHLDNLNAWLSQANGFGTVIVLQPDSKIDQESEFEHILAKAGRDKNLVIGKVVDPDYFLVDGSFTHRLVNIQTCIWLFGPAQNIKAVVGSLALL